MWSKTERTQVHSFSSDFTRALTSLSSYSAQECNKRLSSLMDGVCYKRGFGLYLYYSMVGTELSVSYTQVRRLCLSFTPRESFRWPLSHRLCVDALDLLLESVEVV